MPELTVIHIAMLAGALLAGLIVGWFVRADRCAKEKLSLNAGWQKELDSQSSEHERLSDQNKGLMEQVSQYQASRNDYDTRAKELSDSLKEAYSRRDELQRQLKDANTNLNVAVAQRDRLYSHIQGQPTSRQEQALKEKDDKIFRLSRELTNWQSRVPPLVERFQEKSREATELADALETAEARIAELETKTRFDQTRIEPLDTDALPDGGDASNEPVAETSQEDVSALRGDAESANDEPDEEWQAEAEDAAEAVGAEADEEPTDSPDDVPGAEESDEVLAAGDDPHTASLVADEASGIFDIGEPEEEAGEGPNLAASAEDGLDADTGAAADEAQDDTDDDSDDDTADEIAAEAANNHDDAAADDVPADDKDSDDDLQQIKGIGPSIAATLAELGIRSYRQLAEISEPEIDRVAQQLRGFRSRIYREDWIGQARDLQYRKSHESG